MQAVSQIDKVKIKGWELEATVRPLPELIVQAGYGYIDNKITEFRADPTLVGNRSPYVAKDNALVSATWTHDLAANLAANLHIEANRTGPISYVVQAYPGSIRDPVTLANARAGLTWHQVEFALWGRNLFDKHYNSDVVPLLPVLQAVFRAFPRTYGAEVNYKF